MNSTTIKNLAISVEALSRQHSTKDSAEAVKRLLDREIALAEEEQYRPKTTTDIDDDIPF